VVSISFTNASLCIITYEQIHLVTWLIGSQDGQSKLAIYKQTHSSLFSEQV
jgi:hypothetical protein